MFKPFPSGIKRRIAGMPKRHVSRSGYWLKREDVHSNRERAEAESVSKTQVYGVVSAGRRAHQPEDLQRMPTKTGAVKRPKPASVGKGLFCPEPRNPGI